MGQGAARVEAPVSARAATLASPSIFGFSQTRGGLANEGEVVGAKTVMDTVMDAAIDPHQRPSGRRRLLGLEDVDRQLQPVGAAGDGGLYEVLPSFYRRLSQTSVVGYSGVELGLMIDIDLHVIEGSCLVLGCLVLRCLVLRCQILRNRR